MSSFASEEAPLVSIVIPTHNRAELLPRALKSALGQSYGAVEVIVVDDGSTDGTELLVGRWRESHPNLVYLRNEHPCGASAARNRGFRQAGGAFIAMLDDDDEFTPDRIASLLAVYRRDSRWSFVCSDYVNIRRNGIRRSSKAGRITLDKILWMNYASQSVLVPRDRMLAIGGFDESFSAAQDYDVFTRLIEAYGPAYRLARALYIYHQEHDTPRISTTSTGKIKGYYQYYCKHKGHMTRAQRAWHLYRLLKLRGRRLSPGHFLRMVPPRFFLLEINDYFIEHTTLYLWLSRIKDRFRRRD